MKSWLLTSLTFISYLSFAQPYDSLLMVGVQSSPDAPSNTLDFNFCMASISIADLQDSTYNRNNWSFLPAQQIDNIRPQAPPNQDIPRGLGPSVNYATPGSKHWLVSSGMHTWDSLNRRVTTFPLAWRAAEQRGFGFDAVGHYGNQNHLMLPRRDSLGKFYHLVMEYSWQAEVMNAQVRQSADQILLYHVDATEDRNIPEITNGNSGNGRHLRYRPEPIDSSARHSAIAWQAGRNAYHLDRTQRPELSTVAHLVGIPHGNGRDWWVIALGGQTNTKSIAIFLLDNEGLNLKHHYADGIPFYRGYSDFFHSAGQVAVSPDGNHFAIQATPTPNKIQVFWDELDGAPFDPMATGLVLWDFDRCSGQITNTQQINVDYQPTGLFDRYFDNNPPQTSRAGNGVAFGRNSRYLFYSEGSYIARVDLSNSDIARSQQLLPIQVGNHVNCTGSSPDLMGYPDFRMLSMLPSGLLISHPGGGCRFKAGYYNADSEDYSNIYGGLAKFETPCISNSRHMIQPISLFDDPGSSCDTLGIDGWNPDCNPFRPDADTAYVCSGGVLPDTLNWRGKSITVAGLYSYHLQDPRGCDSIWQLVVVEDQNFGPIDITVQADAGDIVGGVIVNRDTSFQQLLFTSSGCDSLINYTVDVTSVSTNSRRSNRQLQVFPNPVAAQTAITVVLPEDDGASFTSRIEMFDYLGRLAYRLDSPIGPRVDVATDAFSPGVYVLHYLSGDALWQVQVVVQ